MFEMVKAGLLILVILAIVKSVIDIAECLLTPNPRKES
jgi:hypothetical protein